MSRTHVRALSTAMLALLLCANAPLASMAAISPPSGGNGTTVQGQVVDLQEDDGTEEGEVEEAIFNDDALYYLGGLAIALAILIEGDIGDTSPVGDDCSDLFNDIELNEGQRANSCDDRNGAAMLGPLMSLAAGAALNGPSMMEIDATTERNLGAGLVAESRQPRYNLLRNQALVRLGQPTAVGVKVSLDDYLMAGKEYPVTFTVTAASGADLDSQLYLTAADLQNAGEFTRELGYPFAVPVDMDVLAATGTWSYSTPYQATSGAYAIDAFVGTHLPAQLIAETRTARVIDDLQAQLTRVENRLAGTRGVRANALAAERAALQTHLVWLMEWSREL